ncbi:MAG: adenosine kinase [Bacteroidales bacterium]
MKVLGIGNALVDILTNLESDAYFEKMGLIKGGMKLIEEEQLLKIVGLIEGMDSKLASGGSASNTIAGLARMGIDCGFIGKVGNDAYGKFYREDLINNGVHPKLTETEMASGCAMCMITPDGERTMGTFLGAAATLHANDLEQEMFKGYDILHAEGYLVQDHELILKAFQLAKAEGLKISIDLASFNIVEGDLDFFKMLVKDYVDIVFANEEESYAYTKQQPEQAVITIARECEIAVVKKGSKGSIVKRDEETIEVGVLPANCIDTTGAGDLYAAGFLYGFTQNLSLTKCAQIGAVLSGNVVEVTGPKMVSSRWDVIKSKVADIIAQ